MSERFSRKLPQMISSVRLPSAPVLAPTSVPIVFRFFPLLPNTFLAEMPPSMPSLIFRHACVFGQTVEQALTFRDHSDGQVLLSPFVRQNSSPNHYLTQHCWRVFGQVKSISTCTGFGPKSRQDGSFGSFALPGHERYWNGFSFLQIILNHHTYQRAVLRTDTDTLLLCLRQTFIVSSLFVRIGIGIVEG